MAINDFKDFIYPVWYKDDNNNPITIQRTNESYQIIKNKILLKEIPNEFEKVNILNYYEIPLGKTPTSNQFTVDYYSGEITFDSSQDAKTVLVTQYYARGCIYIFAERVISEFDENSNTIKETLADISKNFKAVGEYDSTIKYLPRNIVTYGGSSYIAIQISSGINPLNTFYWQRIAQAGQGLKYQGAYNSNFTYNVQDFISYNNLFYYCKVTTTGNLPTNTTYWTILPFPISMPTILTNVVTVGSSPVSSIDIGISAFNPTTDYLRVVANTTTIWNTQDYTIVGTTINKTSGTWNAGTVFYIEVLKNIIQNLIYTDGSMLENGSIAKIKCTTDVRNILDTATDNIPVDLKILGADSTGVVDCSTLFKSLLENTSINEIFLPDGIYKINITSSGSNKRIYGKKPHYVGLSLVGGTIISGTLNLDGTNIIMNDFGIQNNSGNGIFIFGDASNIKGKNLLFNIQNHAVLIEQNGGTVNTIDFLDCESYGGIHGFVSKAKDVKFINCKAYNAVGNGYCAISDNMNGENYKSICSNTQFLSCFADTCNIGFASYSRDYTSENNSAEITCDNISILGCTAKNSIGYGMYIGDGGSVSSGQTYNDVNNFSIINYTSINNVNASIYFGRCNKVLYDDCNFDTALTKSTYAKNLKEGINNYLLGGGQATYPTQLTSGSATPSVINGDTYFELNNSSYQEIYNFIDGMTGQTIIIRIKENNSVILKNSLIDIPVNIKGLGSVVCLRQNTIAGQWQCVYFYNESDENIVTYNSTTTTVDWSRGSIASIVLTGNVSTIAFSNANAKSGKLLTVILYGDTVRNITNWDSSIKWGTKPTATISGKKIMMQFYYDGINYSQVSYNTCDI